MELGRGMNNSLDRSKFSGGLIAAVSNDKIRPLETIRRVCNTSLRAKK